MDTYNASRRQQKEAVCSSELMPCTNQAARSQNSEAHMLDLYSRENIKYFRRVVCRVKMEDQPMARSVHYNYMTGEQTDIHLSTEI
jgi:hypothetical protein